MFVDNLLWKLRRVEAAVPNDIRNDDNYFGLRIDETGQWLAIAKRDFPNDDDRTGVIEGAPDTKLVRFQHFREAYEAQGLRLAPTVDIGFRFAANCKAECSCDDATELCRAGDACYPVDHSGRDAFDDRVRQLGTLGWFFYINDVLTGISNQHVLCPNGDQTPLGSTRVYKWLESIHSRKNYDLGGLFLFAKEHATYRVLDAALVRIADERLISGTFRRQASGANSKRPYPLGLAGAGSLMPNQNFYLVGAKSPDLRLNFAGVGSRKASTERGTSWLREQLFFYGSNQDGDSGAVVVHETSNQVIGLNVGGDSKFTVACPLYRLPWDFCGTRKIHDCTEVPCFRRRGDAVPFC